MNENVGMPSTLDEWNMVRRLLGKMRCTKCGRVHDPFDEIVSVLNIKVSRDLDTSLIHVDLCCEICGHTGSRMFSQAIVESMR